MSFFGRIVNHLVSGAVVDKLANTKLMQGVAAKVVEFEKQVASHAKQVASDPNAANAAATEQASKVWDHLTKQIANDWDRLTGGGTQRKLK